MEPVEKVAFFVRTPENIHECIRSAVGLGLDNRQVAVFIVGAVIPDEERTEEFSDRIDMIDDLEGLIWTDVAANQEAGPVIRLHGIEEMAKEMAACDLVVSF